jgi:hypothetical protein
MLCGSVLLGRYLQFALSINIAAIIPKQLAKKKPPQYGPHDTFLSFSQLLSILNRIFGAFSIP